MIPGWVYWWVHRPLTDGLALLVMQFGGTGIFNWYCPLCHRPSGGNRLPHFTIQNGSMLCEPCLDKSGLRDEVQPCGNCYLWTGH